WSTAALRRLGYRKFAVKMIDPDVQEAQQQKRTRRVAAPRSLMHENIEIIEKLLMMPEHRCYCLQLPQRLLGIILRPGHLPSTRIKDGLELTSEIDDLLLAGALGPNLSRV